MKAIQGREKRWARQGRLLSLFGCLPLKICMSLLRCPEKRRRWTEGSGKGQESGQRKGGQGGDQPSGTVSHCLTLVSCPFFDARNDQRKTEKERRRRKEKKGVSNSSDRGTPQRKRNCLLHCQPWQYLLPLHSVQNTSTMYIRYVTLL